MFATSSLPLYKDKSLLEEALKLQFILKSLFNFWRLEMIMTMMKVPWDDDNDGGGVLKGAL